MDKQEPSYDLCAFCGGEDLEFVKDPCEDPDCHISYCGDCCQIVCNDCCEFGEDDRYCHDCFSRKEVDLTQECLVFSK